MREEDGMYWLLSHGGSERRGGRCQLPLFPANAVRSCGRRGCGVGLLCCSKA